MRTVSCHFPTQLAQTSLPLTSASLASLPPFCPVLSRIATVHKTGLGSSAAMITSLTGALLHHLGALTLPPLIPSSAPTSASTRSLTIVHNVAQFCHCLAQGKIGSGFDVSAAVHGTHVYRRFAPRVLEGLMPRAADPLAGGEIYKVVEPANVEWDGEVRPFALPPSFHLLLADIDAGSSTPKLVSQVLSWRAREPFEAKQLWARLDSSNTAVANAFTRLSGLAVSHAAEYAAVVAQCAKLVAPWHHVTVGDEERPILQALKELHHAFLTVRACMRELSTKANVPIEPEEQTRLLNACMAVPGVIMAGVPGAGGMDAIFCITLEEGARLAVEAAWSGWKEMSAGPLLARQSSGGLGVVDERSAEAVDVARAVRQR
ncbi:hypothetical protein BDK51DRAFT_37793 [Blyttiomyces helicus]|uniref:phosphomevalonate kinase n=1 Tax=Blyttiomyces helicus TaxID=388810 RepID=A0A4P9WBR1_9FUNG|nr:hypothetical protein BDK51DRAFT_37793 [Blyttiomyces helicus]|eukprot:RKO88993.1 hypothetical protein BDK51DRAFT_37793 [Blyttiomyces helicus]